MVHPQPGLFMQNIMGQAANIKDQGKIIQPWPKDLPVALIDVRDTGALGARVLREPDKHDGKLYSFSGVSTTFGEFAKVIGETIGKPITYVEVTLEQAEAGMKSRNMPDWLVAHLVSIARAGGKGAFSQREHAADPRHRRPRADHDASSLRRISRARWAEVSAGALRMRPMVRDAARGAAPHHEAEIRILPRHRPLLNGARERASRRIGTAA